MEVRKEQIMKYVIYRFPDVIRFDRDDQYAEPYVVRKRGITKDALRGEIVAVEYGSDIEAVKDVLIKNIQEEMSHTYHCESDVFGPDSPDVVYLMTDEPFDYEMNAWTRRFAADADDEVNLYFGIKELPE